MIAKTIRLDQLEYKTLQAQAKKHGLTLAEEVREVIRKGLLIDAPKRTQQVQIACIIESVLILRKLAERQDERIADEAYKEAHQLVEKLFAVQS